MYIFTFLTSILLSEMKMKFSLAVSIHTLSEYMISSFIKCELRFIMSNLYRPYFAIMSIVNGSSVHILSIKEYFY